MQEISESKKGITGSTLKWIAVFSMLIDHSACILISPILVEHGIYSIADCSAAYITELIEAGSVGWFYLAYQIMRRLIGRLAFPIYCFCLIEGFSRTGNKKKYAGRLAAFALLSEVPFDLGFYNSLFDMEHQNVFFTLLLGFLMIWGMDTLKRQVKRTWLAVSGQVFLFLAAAFLAEWISCDYGARGILALVLLYQFRYQKGMQILVGCIAFIWEPAALLAFIPIGLYRGGRGRQNRWFFYAFYPVHILILYFLTKILQDPNTESFLCFIYENFLEIKIL